MSGVGETQPTARARSRALLISEDTFAFVLLTLVIDSYPPDPQDPENQGALGWTATTVKMQLEKDFAITLPRINLDKIMMAIVVFTTNRFFKDTRTFIDACNIFAGDQFDPETFNPADPGEILWGVTEAALIYPPNEDPDDTEFSPEIRAYIGETLETEGIANPPDVLRLGIKGNIAEQIRSDYADDPEMYSAIWQAQEGKNQELSDMMRANLAAMGLQFQVLPLDNGSTQAVCKQLGQIAANLPKKEPDHVEI